MGKIQRQKDFLKHFRDGHGIVTYACDKTGISRETYRQWKLKDPKFKAACEEVSEVVLDVVESKLLNKINDEDLTAIIFYLKTKGKHRGYVERVENNVSLTPFEDLMMSLPDDDDLQS